MLALLNAVIHTLDPARPRASALLVRGDRIAAVGDDRQVLSAASGPVERLDGPSSPASSTPTSTS